MYVSPTKNPLSQFTSPSQIQSAGLVHANTVRRWIRDGDLPAVRIGREFRIRVADLDQFLASGRASAGPESLPHGRRPKGSGPETKS